MTAPNKKPLDDDDDAQIGDQPPGLPGQGAPDNPTPVDDGTDDQDDDSGDPAGADSLGDAGKRALDAMKARLKRERQARRAAEAERDTLKVAGQQDAQTQAIEKARQEAAAEAERKANMRIIRAEVKAAATGKLADPSDALLFLDLEQFEVDEHGELDTEDVTSAIEDLIRRKPHLAAAKAGRFQGTGDNGAARKSGTKQVTEAELATMSPEQIEKARVEGRLKDLLTGKKG